MIPPEFVNRVRDASDIVQVVGRHVTLKKAGANWKGLCPFHNEKSPSFNVHPAKQIFHCFGCGEGGDVFSFLIKKEKLSFIDALKALAGEAGLELPEQGPRDEQAERDAKEKEELLKLLELAAAWFRRCLLEGTDAEAARAYALERGLSPETMDRFQLGYAPGDGGALERAALKKGYTRAQLLKAGLVQENERGAYARFRSRLIFPIQDAKAAVVGFGGRVLGAGEPKYLNSPETALFSKGRLLYALPQAKDALLKKKRALLVEGYMDAIACHQAGVHEAVAVLGTALTEDHARQLKRYVDSVALVFDADQAGLRAALRGCEVLLKSGLEPKVVRLGEHKDPDEFIKAKGKEAFEKEIEGAGDALEFLADASLSLAKAAKPGGDLSLREKAGVMQQLFPVLARYATAMEAEVQLRRLSGRLDLSLEAAKADFESYKANPPTQPRERPAGVVTGAGAAPQKAAPSEPLKRVEAELLGLLLAHRSLMAEAAAELPEPDFEDEELQAGARLLWKHPQVPTLSMEDDGSEEYRAGESLLSRLEMQERPSAGTGASADPQAQMHKLLLRRQVIKLERQSAEIQKGLESRPEGEELSRLLGQKQQVARRMNDLKQVLQES